MLSGPTVTKLPSSLHARRSKPWGSEKGKALLKKSNVNTNSKQKWHKSAEIIKLDYAEYTMLLTCVSKLWPIG